MAETQTATKEQQLVIFALAGEVYGVDVGSTREIIRVPEITRVPNAPEFVEGMINLRGKVIPVVDLRKRFGLGAAELSKENRIVVVDIKGEEIGLMVDAVAEVMRISSGCVESASSVVTTEESYYIQGIANLGERMIILLDLDKVLSTAQHAVLNKIKQSDAKTADTTPAALENGEDAPGLQVAVPAGKEEK